MKTLGCLAALVCFIIGFASAGPVAVSGGASMCDIQCGSQNKFRYTPGKSYVYKYSTKTETALEQSSHEKSTIYLDADISLHVMDSCRFVLKVDSAKLDEEISGGARKASKGTQELAESLMKNPLVFNFEDGIVSRLCPAQHESKSALNIKRGILSMIQNKMADFNQDGVAHEDDVVGNCPAVYTVSKGWGSQITILKKRRLSDCKGYNKQQAISVIALPRQIAKSSSMINGTQECTQTIKNSIFEGVQCRERHVVKPFSRQEKGAATEIHQSLQLVRSGANIPSSGLRYPEGEEETLRFDHVAEFEGQEHEMEVRVRTIVQRLASEKNIKDTNEHFSKLVETLRKMRYEPLRKLAMEFKGNTRFLDALASTMTGEAMKLVAELVKSKVIGTQQAQEWLMTVALVTDVDVSRIPQLMALLDMEEITMEAHLAVSAVARTFMEENPSHVPEEITNLLNKLYSQLSSKSGKRLIATLKAIGNLGISNGQEYRLLEATANQDTKTRVAAIEAFRHFPCDSVKQGMLMKLFKSPYENVEVRIAAYLKSITCPSQKMIASIRDTLLAEPKDSQMVSFVFTHMKNLAKRTSFHEDVSMVTSDTRLKPLELDAVNYSKNYFYEMFFSPLDMGFELDAGSVLSTEAYGFMLNTTLDLFGHKVNIFDSKLRVQKDMSDYEMFMRFFGKEIFYGNEALEGRGNSEYDRILKAMMSQSGWKFSRSAMLLDSESRIPTGTGFPLVVGVNGTASLDVDLKATPLHGQGSKLMAETRAAPSLAVRFGVSMMMQAPKTNSGIKMVVTGSSQWELHGRVNMDLSDARMVRNIQIDAPLERSDIIDIKSAVYLVGADSEREIKAIGTNQKKWEACTGQGVSTITGHQACVEASYPEAISSEAPFFMLRGPSHFNVRWVKTDRTLKMFQIQSSFIYEQRQLLELALEMDTPGSQVNRKFKGRLYSDFRSRKFGLDLISPLKSLALEGTYIESPTNKKTQLLVKVDGNTEMSIAGSMDIVNGRVMIMSPTVEITMRGKQILLVKSQIAAHGTQKYNGDVEIHSSLTQKPIKMNAEYSTLNNEKKLTWGIDSAMLRSNTQSSVTQNNNNWDVSMKGDYVYNQGQKHTFGMTGKLLDDGASTVLEGSVERDNVLYATGRGQYNWEAPGNFGAAVELLNGRMKGLFSLDTKNLEKDVITFTAMVSKDTEKYATVLKFQQSPRMSLYSGKFELPNNVQREVALQYDFASAAKRLVFKTDLTGETYRARASYIPSENLHKFNALMELADESVLVSAALGTDPVYQAKLEIDHNGSKLLMTTFGVNKDLKKPDMKAYLQFRDQVLADLTSDTLIEPQKVSVSLSMRAPVELNANVVVGKSGSVYDTLRLETEVDVQSPDQTINMGLTSKAEISLWQRSNKVNVEANIKCPRGNTNLVFNNLLDASSWSLDWRYQTPNQPKRHVLSSGTYSVGAQKLHLRGMFEMDIYTFGRRIVLQPHSLNMELWTRQDELDFNFEITKDTNKTIILLIVKGGNKDTHKRLSVELDVLGKPYHLQMALDGQDLSSGWRASLDSRCEDRSVVGKGNLQWDGQDINLNMDVQTSFEEFSKAKILLKSQTVGQMSNPTRLINMEYALGPNFVRGDMSFGRSLEADVRTSFLGWENLKGKATWDIGPKSHVIINFSSPKYADNVIEIESISQNGLAARIQVRVPAIYRGLLIDGNLKYSNGNGQLNILHRGEQKAKLMFQLKNEETAKNFSGGLSYNIEGVSDRWDIDFNAQNIPKSTYDVKMNLVKNSKQILNANYRLVLSKQNGIMAENRLEVRTSLWKTWQSGYLLNTLIIDSENMRTQHEFGASPRNVLYSIDVSGRLINNNNEMFVAEGKLEGVWDRFMKGSVSAEVKSDKANTLELATRVESDRALVCASKWAVVRRARVVELEGNWEAPKMRNSGSLKMRAGIEEPEAFVFNVKLERNQDEKKTAEISLRLPLEINNIDGHLKLRVPRELGGPAFTGNLMAKKTMFNVNAELSMDNGRQTYSGEAASAWDRDFTLNGMLRKNSNDVARTNLKAAWKDPEAYEVSAEVMHNDVSYKTTIDGAWTEKKGEISMGAESSQWERNHVIRGSYSIDPKTANLHFDVAELKVSIDSSCSNSQYKLHGQVTYGGERIADGIISFNPNSKQGVLDATVLETRIYATVIARQGDGEFKLELPWASGDLIWSVDQQEKLSVIGHWTFENKKWRFEVYGDPHVTRDVEAKLYRDEKPVGNFYVTWKTNEISSRIYFDHAGVQHSGEFGLKVQAGHVKGNLKVNCPYIHAEPIDTEVELKYDQSKVLFMYTMKVGATVHSFNFNGNIQGEHITGNVQVHCPTYSDFNGKLEGNWSQDGFKVKISSEKLKQPIEIEGVKTNEKISFRMKSASCETGGNLFMGPKYGFEIIGRSQTTYEIVAVAQPNKGLWISFQTPSMGKSGIALTQMTPVNYGIEADWLGRRVLQARWTENDNQMMSGVFNGIFDFGGTVGKHDVIVTYSLVGKPSIKVQLDGQVIIDGHFGQGEQRLMGKMTMKFARGGDLTFEVKHELNRDLWLSALRISQNGKALGYEMLLHKDILGSMLRIDSPRRSMLMKLDSKQANGNVSGRLAWDHGRDPQKTIEMTLSQSSESRKEIRGAGIEQHLTISIPKLDEKVIIRVAETEEGHEIQALDEKRSMSAPRMSLTYSKQGRLRMNLGNLMMQAQLSSGKSELILRRMSSREDDINVGYSVQGNTVSARLNWTPWLLSNYELAAKDMLRELQRGPDNKQDKQWRRISDFVESEVQAIRNDIHIMITDLRRLYDQNAWNLRTVFESVVLATERASQSIGSLSEELNEIVRDLKRSVARYSQRLSVASTVLSAIRQEIVEDSLRSIERWLLSAERSISNETLRKFVRSIVDFVRRDYEVIVDALDHAVDEYICEFSSEEPQVTNKRCGFAYELDSQHEQHGLMIRLPLLDMRS